MAIVHRLYEKAKIFGVANIDPRQIVEYNHKEIICPDLRAVHAKATEFVYFAIRYENCVALNANDSHPITLSQFDEVWANCLRQEPYSAEHFWLLQTLSYALEFHFRS